MLRHCARRDEADEQDGPVSRPSRETPIAAALVTPRTQRRGPVGSSVQPGEGQRVDRERDGQGEGRGPREATAAPWTTSTADARPAPTAATEANTSTWA